MANPLLTEKFQLAFPEAMRCQAPGGVACEVVAYRGSEARLETEVAEGEGRVFGQRAWLHDLHLHLRCDCPVGRRGEPCPHLWMALATAERNGDLALACKRNVKREPLWSKPVGPERSPAAQGEAGGVCPGQAKEEEGGTVDSVSFGPDESRPAQSLSAEPSQGFALVVQVELPAAVASPALRLRVFWTARKEDGSWGALKPLEWRPGLDLPDEFSRLALGLLARFHQPPGVMQPAPNLFDVPPQILAVLLPPLARAKRFFLVGEKRSLSWDDSDWEFRPEFSEVVNGWKVSGTLACGSVRLPFAEILWMAKNGLFLATGRAGRFNPRQSFDTAVRMREDGEVFMLKPGAESLVQHLVKRGEFGQEEFPVALCFPVQEGLEPVGRLHIRSAKFKFRNAEWLHADLEFEYGSVALRETSQDKMVFDSRSRRAWPRDWPAEYRRRELLLASGFRYNENPRAEELGWKLAPRQLDAVVRELLGRGWHITAEGKTWRLPTDKKLTLAAGADWFELQGGLEFNGEFVPLPRILEAIREERDFVLLGDGSFGVLPLDWLLNYTMLTEFAVPEGDALRLGASQMYLLNSLIDKLGVVPEAEAEAARRRLLETQAVCAPAPAPAGFVGKLRHYQEAGLGWMLFLQRLGFGGCLADDMGLGKTVQVLAMLQHRKEAREAGNGEKSVPGPLVAAEGAGRPSLLVLPRSLVFNWEQEARRFTPGLRLHFHLGGDRMRRLPLMPRADLVLTTYGTLRRDAPSLRHFQFDVCILDEAQAVKNASSGAAKAARLIRAAHRLAMTGTPVENSLADLLSLFEFLNPGLIQYASVFRRIQGDGRPLAEAEAQQLRQAVSPLILRRTKRQAAPELPPKTEQVLWCDMTPPQRHQYEELRAYYRQTLLRQEAEQAPARLETLSALLRLRQAACHPGLIDPAQHATPSGKVELIVERLQELLAEGHKILVFSQFVRFLRLLQERLIGLGAPHSYLDGQTVDRQAEVETFQNAPGPRVFLISLKAGGVGLNLTAADHVFLVDPWWNPAVENQAIDRAFRIGQTRQVFAYRFITRGTVEEKIMQMQERKRQIAAAVVHEAGEAPMPELFTQDALQFLLE